MPAATRSQPTHRSWSGLLRGAIALLACALLLPYLLVPLYRVVQPVSTLMLWRWATGARVEREFVPIDRVSAVLPLAVIVAEDARFCSHHGIDWREIRAALQQADDFGTARGGSTITQQTAKNLFLWPGRSLVRKALELPLALWIDLVLPKRRVLEIYLNIAEWGPNGEFGAEAGARAAFAKSARDLEPQRGRRLGRVAPQSGPPQRSPAWHGHPAADRHIRIPRDTRNRGGRLRARRARIAPAGGFRMSFISPMKSEG